MTDEKVSQLAGTSLSWMSVSPNDGCVGSGETQRGYGGPKLIVRQSTNPSLRL